MGLFGSILSGMGGILGAVVGGMDNKKAIKKASAANLAAQQQAIDEQRRQFDITRTDYAPWITAGQHAIGAQADLSGLNGNDQQTAAIDALKASPFYQRLFANGQEAVLQNSSATGGLRGGNAERSLADFGSDTLATTIQQQLANLGGISSGGASLTSNLGGLGANMANNVSGLFIDQGKTRAGSILGRQQVDNGVAQSIQKIIGMFMPTGGF